MFHIEGRIEAAQCVASVVVCKGVGVLPALFKRLAEGEMQLRRIGALDFIVGELVLHCGDLGIAEGIVLEVREAPICLCHPRIHVQRRFVGGFALTSPAECLVDVADGQPQPHFFRFEPRRLLVGLESPLLAHEPRRHRTDRDPGLWVFRLDFEQTACSRLSLLETPQRHERLPHSPPCQRMVRRLPQRMTKQALGIAGLVGRERECGKTAQRRQVARIILQDFANDPLGRFAVVGHQGGRRLLDELTPGIGEPCTLEGESSVGILLEIHEHIAVRKPGEMVMRHVLQNPPHFLTRPRGAPLAPVGTRQINARLRKIGGAHQNAFEGGNAFGDLVLVQQCGAQEPEAIRLSGQPCIERAQPALGGRAAGAQRGERLGRLSVEAALGCGAVMGSL